MSLAYRFTFEQECTGNETLSVSLCVDPECKTYCLHRYHVIKYSASMGRQTSQTSASRTVNAAARSIMRAISQSEALQINQHHGLVR